MPASGTTAPTIAVIIPYYQERQGILRRALESVLAQNLPAGIHVDAIVTDDGSPVPAEGEIEGLPFAEPFTLKIIRQQNGGVSAARNTCLGNVSKDTAYIALLDSDDIWKPDHLATALTLLERGYDFYFCNSLRPDAPITALTHSREKAFRNFLDKFGQSLGDDFYEVPPRPFFDAMLKARIFAVPATVYRRSIAPDLAFDATLRLAGEDCLFLYQLMQKARRIGFSLKTTVLLGDGVNIFVGRQSWDNPGQLPQLLGRILGNYRLLQQLDLSDENRRVINGKTRGFREKFAFLSIRNLIKHRAFWPQELRSMIPFDRSFWFWFPLYTIYVTVGYPLGLYNPIAQSKP